MCAERDVITSGIRDGKRHGIILSVVSVVFVEICECMSVILITKSVDAEPENVESLKRNNINNNDRGRLHFVTIYLGTMKSVTVRALETFHGL